MYNFSDSKQRWTGATQRHLRGSATSTKVHYCFVCIHYETYFAKWVVGWWEIIRRPRKVWVTTELAGCISLYSHCFSTPLLFYSWRKGGQSSQFFTYVFEQQIFYFSCTFFLKRKEKKNFGGLRPTCRPHLHSCGPMCCIWHAGWARECVWQLRRVAFDSFTSVTR